MMSQISSHQTRIDQFYKVVSNKNTGCGVKLHEQKRKFQRKSNTPLSKTKKSLILMSSLVESEVKIIGQKTPVKKSNGNFDKIKRGSSFELTNSSKKLKVDKTIKSDDSQNYRTPTKSPLHTNNNSQTPLKLKGPNNDTLDSSTPANNNGQTPLKERSSNNEVKQLSSPIRVNNNIHTPLKVRSPNSINSSAKKSNFSPKTPTSNNSSPQKHKFSPRKLFFADRINIENVQQAIENLNLVRQNSIQLNEFDLEKIYKNQDFNMIYSDNIIPNSRKFEIKDVTFPQEKHADHLLMVVMDVFSNPINCGYFLKDELDLIFSLFTLAPESQMLFVRLLKRKLAWHRISSIKYPEIATDLNPFFKELVQNKFCISDLDSIDISALLNMLQLDEIRSMCQRLKIDHHGNKMVLMNKLLKYGSNSRSFFMGAKSPKAILRSTALSILQLCVCLSEDIINLFDRVLTLLHPVQDASESIADLFLLLTNVHKGEVLYPPIPEKESFPIFQNRSHLIGFVQSKNALKQVIDFTERKEWDAIKDLGRLALEQLSKVQSRQEDSLLPSHIKKFAPEFVWVKVLAKSIDAFKKSPETIPEAVNILETLINKKTFSQRTRGRWYSELALIEMHHRKDLEKSATLTLHALQKETLTEVDISDLLGRLKKLMRRKSGLSKETKEMIQKAQEEIQSDGLNPHHTYTKTITANMANRIQSGGKSKWSISINGNDKFYGSVELLALHHYTDKEDFHEGLHCEGSLPVTLFTVFFWEELYNIFVPGVFVSPYQEAPLDLFTSDFFDNRKKSIGVKLKFIEALDIESFADWMQERFSNYSQYKSIMPNNLFKNEQHFREVVTCLGITGVKGICERLVSNYRLWRSGFPDLIVWNVLIQKCKIVEVKGPGDSLSEKQKHWLQYLERLGIAVEVCHVEAFGRGSK